MSSAREIWAAIGQKETELRQQARAMRDQQHTPFNGDSAYIVSQENMRNPQSRSGIISQVSLKMAAKALLEGTATIATTEEVQAHREHQNVLRASYEAANRRSMGVTMVGIASPIKGRR